MRTYSFRAYRGPGVVERGKLAARSEDDAELALAERGLELVELREAGPLLSINGSEPRQLRRRERAEFARQLATAIVGGMTLRDSLVLVAREASRRSIRSVARELAERITAGQRLSDALDALRPQFTSLHSGLVRAGEEAGVLSHALEQLAEIEERAEEARSRLVTALVYPGVTAGVGVVVLGVLLGFVVPRLGSLFEEMGRSLPLPTQILLRISNVVIAYPGLVAAGVVVAALVIAWAFRRGVLQSYGMAVLSRAPVTRRFIEASRTAHLAGVLGAELKSGVRVVPALRICAGAVEDLALRSRIDTAADRVENGEGIAAALESEGVFPGWVTALLAVGEAGGLLPVSLERIRASAAADAERGFRLMLSLLEPALIVGLGMIVAFIVMSVLLPIYQIDLATP